MWNIFSSPEKLIHIQNILRNQSSAEENSTSLNLILAPGVFKECSLTCMFLEYAQYGLLLSNLVSHELYE